MFSATDFASKLSSRWVLLALGSCLGFSEIGCAKLHPFGKPEPPMLGSAAPFGDSVKSGKGDFYAQQVGKGTDQSRALLAQQQERERQIDEEADSAAATSGMMVRSTEHPTNPAESRSATGGKPNPLDVALQAPETIGAGRPTPGSGPASNAAPVALASLANSKPVVKPASSQADPAAARSSRELESILSASRKKLNSMATYQVTLKRQERVGETLQPAEEALLSIRRTPKAVRLEWPTGPHKGREVIYATGDGDGLLHVNMADSLVPLVPLALAPDSPLALRSSRHPISEAGFDHILENLEKGFKPATPNDKARGKVSYAGLENPGQLERPSHKIVRVTPAGETWIVYIDPETKLPTMVQCTSMKNELLERYLFGSVKADVADLASADAFDPAKRWGGASKNLLQRLARAGGSKPTAENTSQ